MVKLYKILTNICLYICEFLNSIVFFSIQNSFQMKLKIENLTFSRIYKVKLFNLQSICNCNSFILLNINFIYIKSPAVEGRVKLSLRSYLKFTLSTSIYCSTS